MQPLPADSHLPAVVAREACQMDQSGTVMTASIGTISASYRPQSCILPFSRSQARIASMRSIRRSATPSCSRSLGSSDRATTKQSVLKTVAAAIRSWARIPVRPPSTCGFIEPWVCPPARGTGVGLHWIRISRGYSGALCSLVGAVGVLIPVGLGIRTRPGHTPAHPCTDRSSSHSWSEPADPARGRRARPDASSGCPTRARRSGGRGRLCAGEPINES
jgi:hypothetical protein